MKDRQEKLMPYVEHVVAEIIREKEESGSSPLLATELEVSKNVRNDIIECMRELHRNDTYDGTIIMNNYPALKKKI